MTLDVLGDMDVYKSAEMDSIRKYEAPKKSVGGSRGKLKRSRSSSGCASSSATQPSTNKARRGQRHYPGGHIEVWHKSSGTFQSENPVCFPPVQPKVSLAAVAPPEQQSQSCISQIPDRHASVTQGSPGDGIIPVHCGGPSYEATFLEQWSHQPVNLFQSSLPATDLSLPTSDSTLSIYSPNTANTTFKEWAGLCSETLSSPETFADGSNLANGHMLPGTQYNPTHMQLEGGELPLYNTQTYQDHTSSYLAELFHPDFYLPLIPSNELAMGGGQHFPAPDQAAVAQLTSKSEEECEQLPPHHGSWDTHQPVSALIPNCWFDNEPPPQPLPQAANEYTSPAQSLGNQQCLNEITDERQMSHKEDVVTFRTRQASQSSQPAVVCSGEEEILTVSEDSQDSGQQQCTCDTQSPQSGPCPFCLAFPQSWVMVTYKYVVKDSLPAEPDKKPPKPRKPLEEYARQQTSQTRSVGACVRCKIQRVRCVPNSDEPSGPCEGCSRVAQNYSRKVLHHIGCHRYKLQELVLFRTSGSRVTDRWNSASAQVRNVMTQGETLTIQMMQDFVNVAFTCRVRKIAKTDRSSFQDKITRDWWDGGVVKSERIGDYALVDVHQTMADYKSYIKDSVLGSDKCQPAIVKMINGFSTAVIGEVYGEAWRYFCCLPSANETWNFFYQPPAKKSVKPDPSRLVSDKEFLLGFFEFQFALRHGCGWSWVLKEGIPDNVLGKPLEFPPLENSIGTPRIVVGQIDCIRISCVLKPLAKSLLKVLMSWIADRQYNRWMSVFFATFILLCELSKATEDAYHHGFYDVSLKRNGPKNAHLISDIHESANIILAHWHYYNCSTDPGEFSKKNARSKTPLRALTPEQLATVQQLWGGIKEFKQRRLHGDDPYEKGSKEGWWQRWCHSMYFADQMVDTNWTPRQVFS